MLKLDLIEQEALAFRSVKRPIAKERLEQIRELIQRRDATASTRLLSELVFGDLK